MNVYDRQCEEGRELERDEQLARVEQQIAFEQQIADEKARWAGEAATLASLNAAASALNAALSHDRPTTAALALAALAEAHTEAMGRGEMCAECGEEFTTAQGMPSRCTECGGAVPVSPWYAGGRYFANAGDAQRTREQARDRRERFRRRAARYFAEVR